MLEIGVFWHNEFRAKFDVKLVMLGNMWRSGCIAELSKSCQCAISQLSAVYVCGGG